MSVEPFVLLPFHKWKSMDEQLRKKSHLETIPEPQAAPPDMNIKPMRDGTVSNVETSETSPVPALGKDLVGQQSAANIRKQVEYLKTAHKGAFDHVDNLEELVKNAVSNSKKVVRNEKQFYEFLFKHSLGGFVRNRYQIEKYFKSPWYLI